MLLFEAPPYLITTKALFKKYDLKPIMAAAYIMYDPTHTSIHVDAFPSQARINLPLLNCKNKQSRCINRDENLVNNMIMLTNYYLQHKDRPEKFKRSYKLMDYQIKDTNPNSNISVKCLSSPL